MGAEKVAGVEKGVEKVAGSVFLFLWPVTIAEIRGGQVQGYTWTLVHAILAPGVARRERG